MATPSPFRCPIDPFLTYSSNRPLREKVWRNYYSRGDNGDKYDNNKIIAEILKIRAARAKLLGYETHAHWRMEPTMAKKPEAAMDLMMKVWPKALARVREEVADMQAIANEEGVKIKIDQATCSVLTRFVIIQPVHFMSRFGLF